MQLYHRVLGKGDPILILHGLYGASDNWLSIGKQLAETHRVYLIDQRNHGKSPHTPSHTYEDLKSDLKHFVEKNNLQKIILIGHSMGGKAAMFYATSFPEIIKQLIIVDISTRDYRIITNNIVQTTNHNLMLGAMNKLDLNAISSRSEALKILSRDIHNMEFCQFLLKNLKRTKSKTFKWKINLSAINANIDNMLEGVAFNQKHFINYPVLFIKAEKSKYIMDDDYFLIRKIFPKAEIVTIPNAGHWVHIEQPELLIKTIRYFIC